MVYATNEEHSVTKDFLKGRYDEARRIIGTLNAHVYIPLRTTKIEVKSYSNSSKSTVHNMQKKKRKNH